MPLYEQHVDGVKVGRAFTVVGTDDDARHAAWAATGVNGWQLVDEHVDELPQTPVKPGGRPAQSAPKTAWTAWAVARGMDRDQADDLTKAQLIELAAQLEEE